MSDVGFLYVLANSVMPGLVKVGKTTRSPAERAAELSAATGLPTPFIVVYEQLFQDCSEAEDFVHTFLASKGFRVSDNREFFSAPVNDVVRAIVLAPGAIDGSGSGGEEEGSDDDDGLLSRSGAGDELDNLGWVQQPPWQAVFYEAERHHYGFDDGIKDYAEAMRLYKQAAKLGCLAAYSCIGNIYRDGGEGVRENKGKALEFYKEGARKGSLICYAFMGNLYLCSSPPNYENVLKCFLVFAREFKQRPTTSDGYVDSHDLDLVAIMFTYVFIGSKVDQRFELPQRLLDFSMLIADRIIKNSKERIEKLQEEDREISEKFKKVVDFYSKKIDSGSDKG